jgi:uncharacterized protein
MKLRNASLLALVLAATAACKKSEERPPVAPVTQGGSNAGSAAAQPADPWSKPEPQKDPLDKPLFWKLEKDGITSYVLGTMHIGVDARLRLPDIVWQKLDESKIFAMETDLSGAAKLDVIRKDGTTLRDELGDEYWKKLEEAIGVQEAERLNQLKPMIPATLLSLRGLPETPPMDGVLHGRAINQKKKIVFLEALEHQSAMLEKWMTARALKDMLDDLAGGEQRAKDMLAAYLAGDDAKIIAISDEEKARWVKKGRAAKEYDEQMEDLLYRRNASWIEPIEKLHAEGGGFIAVGAMHAIGPRSILELLDKKGYKITRITP